MATAEYSATAGTVRATAKTDSVITSVISQQAKAASNSTDGAAFTAALATLVADGASPTQAHVTACNNAWTTYKADIDAQTINVAAINEDMSVYIGSLANISDLNVLENCWRDIKRVISGGSGLAVGSGNPRNP